MLFYPQGYPKPARLQGAFISDDEVSALVEFLSTCPTNWGFTPPDAINWLRENMMPYYPLGVYKMPEGLEND